MFKAPVSLLWKLVLVHITAWILVRSLSVCLSVCTITVFQTAGPVLFFSLSAVELNETQCGGG